MTLNLAKFVPPPVKPLPPSPKDKYASPIGWWKVSTAKNYDGAQRSLGIYYGHIAEIALSITEHPFYDYEFHPLNEYSAIVTPAPKEVPHYTPVRKSCDIGLGIESNTWNMSPKQRADSIREWLDTPDIIVKEGQYYKSTVIELAPHLIHQPNT